MYYCNKCGHYGEDGPGHCKRAPMLTPLEACHYDAVKVKDGAALTVQEIANTVAQFLPLGYTLSLRIERGSAWVEVTDAREVPVPLPDAADKSLYQQINDGLCRACGWPA